jgi:sec-independent protein translocase protein TatB
MFGVNSWELVVLALLFVLLFGPDRLPEIASQVARLLAELRQATDSATSELTRELDAASREVKRTEATFRQAGDAVVKGITKPPPGTSAAGAVPAKRESAEPADGDADTNTDALGFRRTAAEAASALSRSGDGDAEVGAGQPTEDDAYGGGEDGGGEDGDAYAADGAA